MHRTRLSTIALALLLPAAARAQENLEMGKMWTFENPPLAYLQKEYGFAPTQEWLDMLRLASLRFGRGCSASFVSPKGLIMTNHHCARDMIAQVSPKGSDWVKDGFVAADYSDEVPIPGLTVQQLMSMQDVTERMNAGIADGDDAATIERKRATNEKAIADEARKSNPGLEPQVVRLHQGAVFQLYLYRVYSDVRLVVAPHLQAAHFGGDPDNFTYPRYSIDFAFCRAYLDGKPADTSRNYFKWSSTGPQEGEVLFVTGNPGSTGRLLTKAQMEYLRDAAYPMQLGMIDDRVRILSELGAQGPELEAQVRTPLLSLQNAQKAFRGYLNGLLDPKLMAQKESAEKSFRERVDADPALKARFGDVFDALADLAKRKSAAEATQRFHNPGGLPALAAAVAAVRAVGAPAAGDAARKAAAGVFQSQAGATTPTTMPFFVNHLERAQRWLPANDPVLVAILDGKSPKEAAERLAKSKLTNAKAVTELIDGGADAVAKSDDPAVVVARVLAPIVAANERAKAQMDIEERALGARIGQALFAVYGDKVSPDATFTLRFSDGVAKGFPYNGTIAPYRTSFYGMFARNVEFDGKYPWDLPQPWLDRKDAIDMTKGVNFVATNDIIGGNSGSPIVNKQLEVVGLIFDGNIEMLANRFVYSDTVARSVSVHVEAILESLRKVYDAGRIADELTVPTGG